MDEAKGKWGDVEMGWWFWVLRTARVLRKESVRWFGQWNEMSKSSEEYKELFEAQVGRLQEAHFLVLLWATQSEGAGVKYNITNVFDDLKRAGITRTKQTAVSAVSALVTLSFLDLRDEHNRKNVYITKWGGKALERILMMEHYKVKPSAFLEGK